ncbi:hypothetical protein CC80DRAFT_496682 [Byssothecium circinans]|uniref:Uncharacterized protein n=1 Tax=Byssothecium circinans TaxID=147558 RepID=A0A6A5TFQ6_9PLEO|nr:hypothetical protein CC80DRAFT_496682 [Byssothecium circinans]
MTDQQQTDTESRKTSEASGGNKVTSTSHIDLSTQVLYPLNHSSTTQHGLDPTENKTLDDFQQRDKLILKRKDREYHAMEMQQQNEAVETNRTHVEELKQGVAKLGKHIKEFEGRMWRDEELVHDKLDSLERRIQEFGGNGKDGDGEAKGQRHNV